MNAKQKQTVRDAVTADKVTFKKDGTVEMRRGYFYSHGNDESKCAARWTEQMAAAGFKATVKEQGNKWQAWPKDSYWHVTFTVEPAPAAQ